MIMNGSLIHNLHPDSPFGNLVESLIITVRPYVSTNETRVIIYHSTAGMHTVLSIRDVYEIGLLGILGKIVNTCLNINQT